MMDYFMKWIEVKALAKITVHNILPFYKKNVLSQFGVPQVLVTLKRMQFIDENF